MKKNVVMIVLFLGMILSLVGCKQSNKHFVVLTGYTVHQHLFGSGIPAVCRETGSTEGMVVTCGWDTGHQWQSRVTGHVCGTTTPENDGEWGFSQLGTDIPHIEFDTEKEAFVFGSQWCKP